MTKKNKTGRDNGEGDGGGEGAVLIGQLDGPLRWGTCKQSAAEGRNNISGRRNSGKWRVAGALWKGEEKSGGLERECAGPTQERQAGPPRGPGGSGP